MFATSARADLVNRPVAPAGDQLASNAQLDRPGGARAGKTLNELLGDRIEAGASRSAASARNCSRLTRARIDAVLRGHAEAFCHAARISATSMVGKCPAQQSNRLAGAATAHAPTTEPVIVALVDAPFEVGRDLDPRSVRATRPWRATSAAIFRSDGGLHW